MSSIDGSYYLWLALVYKYISDWRTWFYINTGIVVVCFFSVLLFLPESPRFYMAHRKFNRARAKYSQVARCNNRPPLTNLLQGELSSEGVLEGQRVNICDLWRGHSVRDRAILIVMPFFWFVSDVISFGLAFSLNSLEGDIYLYGIILGSACIVVAMTTGSIAEWIGRKPTYALVWILNISGSLAY